MNAITKLFAKPQEDVPSLGLAHLALQDHLRRSAELLNLRQAAYEKDAAARRDIEQHDAKKAEVERLRSEIDASNADDHYAGTPRRDLSEKQRALEAAERGLPYRAQVARAAAAVRVRYAEDIGTHNAKLAELNARLPRLLHDTIVESIGEFADEFAAAEAALRAVHRKAFTAALAADKISLAQHYGTFCGSALYQELNITRPSHPAFVPVIEDPAERGRALAAADAARIEDAKQLERDADALVHQLLNGEAES